MIFLIIGPQGSGKGTQAKLIAEHYGLRHISTGDVLREESGKDTERGKYLREYLKTGQLVPNEINDAIVKDIVDKYGKNMILDGYPRNMHQAEYLHSIAKVQAVISLDLNDDESVKRIGKRRICTANNKIFIDDKVTQADIDDCRNQGGEIIIRSDDTPEAVKKRLAIYHRETKPIINYFHKLGVQVIDIDGDQPIEKVLEDIKGYLNPIFQGT